MATLIRLVLVLLAITFSAFATTSEGEHKVVIVGAGISGFAAATTLLENNFTDFVVLEASDRIGGRINTVQFGGVPVDKGAEFVHGQEDNIVYDLVKPYGQLDSYAPLVKSGKHIFADVTGRQYNNTLVYSLVEEAREILYQDYSEHNSSDGSVAGFFYPRLQELVTASEVGAELWEAVNHTVTTKEMVYSAADSLDQLGVRGEGEYVENGGDQTLKWTSRGYKTIFEILSKMFPNASEELPIMEKVLFGKEVQGVDYGQGEGEVVLRCSDGSSYTADHVVITVSLGVLKKHMEMFNPPLPRSKTNAIQTLGIGCVGKVFLLFPTRWWPEDINVIVPMFSKKQLEDFKKNSTHGYWTAYTSGFWPVMQHERMLCAWFSGEACRIMEKLTEEEVIQGLLELLNALVGKQHQIPRPEGILRTNWASYPYTLGSYSFPTPDSDRLNVTRSHLSEPVLHHDKPVLMFAGEATHPHYWGTVHGGLATGVREANNLLKYLQTA
ncbi:spermine oxidase-like [Macrosteles quadrilineatus]|uniref:spermine oxidase-like n=1 Tax=Macrosteles quadrilineatus TaxID=74068 RepID=UPI0023E29173|nr:spermine oxidase-like [Macrosteles quadrilineatus]